MKTSVIKAGRRQWLAVILVAGLCLGACAQAEPWRHERVARIVAVGDVHGAHEALLATLRAAGVLDEATAWAGGDTHLVVTGDLLDRGPDSRPVMDLLMRLETEARAAGGRVHVLLGNHEVMNLAGDLRYVSREEYAAFAADESAEERARWLQAFAERADSGADADELRAQFERSHPPGFFAHRRAFRTDGRYGAWLLEQPLLVVINDTAFVHGGLSPSVAEVGLDGVNDALRAELQAYTTAVDRLVDAALLHPGDGMYARPGVLERLPADGDRPQEIAAAIDTVVRLTDAAVHANDSPVWYRGNVGCSELLEGARLEPVLATLGARRVVLGHTPTVTRDVRTRLGGRIIEIDTGMLTAHYGGSGHALVIEDGIARVVDEAGRTRSVAPDPRPGGAGEIGPEALAAILRTAEATVGDAREDGGVDVTLAHAGGELQAAFYRPRRRGIFPRVAAWRLDRLLGLEMVPVAVVREIDGRTGTLRYAAPSLTDEAARAEARKGGGAWCPLPVQWSAMYLFDTVIRKPRRTAQEILYRPGSWKLVLTGHGDAFDAKGGPPPYLEDVELDVDDAWRGALEALGDVALDEALGDVLDRRRIRAVGRRRDALLEE